MNRNHKLIPLFITFLAVVLLLVSCGAENSAGPTNLPSDLDRQPDTPTKPDLTINSFTVNGGTTNVTVGEGQDIDLAVAGTNIGDGSSELGEVIYYLSDDNSITANDLRVDRDELGVVVGGGTWSETTSVEVNNRIGSYFYGACVAIQANESNKLNNCSRAIQVEVVDINTVEAEPDLSIFSFTLNSGITNIVVDPNAELRVAAIVTNIGRTNSADGMVTFYRSDDNNIDTGDDSLGNVNFTALAVEGAGGSSASLSISPFTAPSEVGVYYYGVCVGFQAGETSQNNNCSEGIRVEVITLGWVLDAPNYTFTSTGAADWFPQFNDVDLGGGNLFMSQLGGSAAQSGAIGDNQQSCMETTVEGPKTIHFYWKVSSERGLDNLIFFIDNTEQRKISGEVDWSPQSYSLTDGSKVLKWCYDKDNSVKEEDDAGWVDRFIVLPANQGSDLTIADFRVNNSDGSSKINVDPGASISLTARVRNSGQEASAAGMVTYYRSVDSSISPNEDVVVETTGSFSSLAVNGTFNEDLGISATVPDEAGEYYYGVCVNIQFNEGNIENNCSSGIRVEVGDFVQLGEAVDNNQYSFSSSGNRAWFGQTNVTYNNGNSAAQSGAIGDDQESCMQTTVVGPKNISFYWKVSSEGGFDFLRFFIGDTEEDNISGDVNWTQQTYTLTDGSKVLKWCYEKDGSDSEGDDAGWVDNFVVTDP